MNQRPRKYMTLSKAAEYLGFTELLGEEKARKKAYHMAHSKKLPFHKIGKELLFIQEEIDEVLDKGRVLTEEEIQRAS